MSEYVFLRGTYCKGNIEIVGPKVTDGKFFLVV